MHTVDKNQIQKLLSMLKIHVSHLKNFNKDVLLILKMFDEIKRAEFTSNGSILRKKVNISDLRKDEAHIDIHLQEMKGKYIVVPPVSNA
jgi:Asp-tRNA(Asn)/Glu-tRNA(Gln) amidotransferase C subunit